MTTFLVTLGALGQLFRAFVLLLKEAEARALILLMISLLLTGTVFYRLVEGWIWLDSLYFCVITLSSIGYGDIGPAEPASKLFTIIYVILGLSIFVSFINLLAKERQKIGADYIAKVHQTPTHPRNAVGDHNLQFETSD